MFDDEIFEDDESLIVSTKTEYDEIENVLRPKSMEGYVGQEKVKTNLAIFMQAAKLREELGEQFVITKGLDGCLSAYSMEKWERMSEIVAGLPQAKARDLKRFMFSSATVVNPDKQGRVLVSPTLRTFAKMTKDIAVIGASDHVELWDRETWIERNAAIDSDDIAAAMDELGF